MRIEGRERERERERERHASERVCMYDDKGEVGNETQQSMNKDEKKKKKKNTTKAKGGRVAKMSSVELQSHR